MSVKERDLLGLLFVAQGTTQLMQGDCQALDSFNIAALIAPENSNIFYRQAEAYVSQRNNTQCLILSCKACQKAVELDPNYFDAWVLWGTALIRRGDCLQETIYLEEAHQKFIEAKAVSHDQHTTKIANLHAQWGLCWQLHGKVSGEACDFHRAVEQFRIAADLGLNHEIFWNYYADVSCQTRRVNW